MGTREEIEEASREGLGDVCPFMRLVSYRAKRDRMVRARRNGASGFGGNRKTMQVELLQVERYSTNEMMRRALEEGAGFWRRLIRRVKDLI